PYARPLPRSRPGPTRRSRRLLPALRQAHFVVGVAARLDVPFELDRPPAGEVAIAAVFGGAVHPFARVLVEELGECAVLAQTLVLVLGTQRREIGPEGGQAVAVALLQPDHRSVELTLGQPERSLDARPPRQLVEGREPSERAELCRATVAARERPAGPDAGRVHGEGP